MHVCSIASIPVLHVICWHNVLGCLLTHFQTCHAQLLHKNLLDCKNVSCTYLLKSMYKRHSCNILLPFQICIYLFLSMSRRSRKTLPESSFLLLTGSNDRLERIKSFSWTIESSSSSQLSSCIIIKIIVTIINLREEVRRGRGVGQWAQTFLMVNFVFGELCIEHTTQLTHTYIKDSQWCWGNLVIYLQSSDGLRANSSASLLFICLVKLHCNRCCFSIFDF